MTHRHSTGRASWHLPAGIMLVGSVLVWPGVSAAAATCTIDPQGPINAGDTVQWSASLSQIQATGRTYRWIFENGAPRANMRPRPRVSYDQPGTWNTSLQVSDGIRTADCAATIVVNGGGGGGGGGTPPDVSINSTSQSCGDADESGQIACQYEPVPEQPFTGNSGYSLVAINDLGMHCGDLDTRISSILPPFQVLLAQVIQKGGEPNILGPGQAKVYYSAVANPNDPILANADAFTGLTANGSVYKTNFWDYPLPSASYDAFYPATNPFTGDPITPLVGPPFNVTFDVGLPVPNVEELYIGSDGQVGGPDTGLSAAQQDMPGILSPYDYATVLSNMPQQVHEHLGDKPFFIDFPFGYVANDVDWFEGAGIPFSAYDDFGRENPFPLVRVQATVDGNPPNANASNVVATVDTVLPISGEASCRNCHADPMDENFTGSRTDYPTQKLLTAGLPVAVSDDDPLFQQNKVPANVAVEWATDINVLRLHDLDHGDKYVATPCTAAPCAPAVCDITANGGLGNANCLTNKALEQNQPVVCQVCHYTPALDLGQFGPQAGAPGTAANGRNQVAHQSNSRVMHNHHSSLTDDTGAPLLDNNGDPLFPVIEPPVQAANGAITNQSDRLGQLADSCYQCHPGNNIQCLRGAMFSGDMLCSDCHGSMAAVGSDFSNGVSPSNPGGFQLGLGNFYEYASAQPRVPWANEPGCGSCHTGDATSNVVTNNNDGIAPADVIVNVADSNGNADGIRLRQAYRVGDSKATPIVPANTRFAENPIPQDFNGFANPGAATIPGSDGARNPKLYRVSTGHGGVMCEGCHGATHAEWPNGNPNANDNLAATQLQGHTGSIIECSTCHTTSQLPSDTQDGPHGMHLVNDTRFWKEAHKDAAKRENGRPGGGTCGSCHGADHLGTVLSRAPVDRTWRVESRDRTVAAGEPVACDVCHSLSKSFDD